MPPIAAVRGEPSGGGRRHDELCGTAEAGRDGRGARARGVADRRGGDRGGAGEVAACAAATPGSAPSPASPSWRARCSSCGSSSRPSPGPRCTRPSRRRLGRTARLRLPVRRRELPLPHLLRCPGAPAAQAEGALPDDGPGLVHELRRQLHPGLPAPDGGDDPLLDLLEQGAGRGQDRRPDGHRRLHLLARHGRRPGPQPHRRGRPARRPHLHQHRA